MEEGDLVDKLLVEGVDAGEGVVELAVGVADEGDGGLVAELATRPHVEDDGLLVVGRWLDSDDRRDEAEDEVPILLRLGALGQVVER